MRILIPLSVAVAALALVKAPTFAQTTDEKLAICAIIQMPLGRLQCYDAIAGRKPPKSDPEKSAMGETWSVTDDISPLDRSRRVILTRGTGADDKTGMLGLRCLENETSVIIGGEDYLGIDRTTPVQYRIGDMAPVSDKWAIGGDRKNFVFGPSGTAAITAIRRMATSDDFVIRITKYGGEQVQYAFQLDGLADHLPLLAEACRWPAKTTSHD